MILALVDEGRVRVDFSGSLTALGAELLMLIDYMYNNINEKDKVLGEAFKSVIKSAVADDMPFKTDEEKELIIKEKLGDTLGEAFDRMFSDLLGGSNGEDKE